ncbi:MAG: tyrosine-type recombinase/integrase [Acidobacteria bacterium]|nr:tyrosine-type recombinase/integrase [Acidobacteriota bacterium]
MNDIPRLIEMARTVSRARALSRKTENAYLNHIRRFQSFHGGRDLTLIGAGGVNDFLNHLKKNEKLAAATRNQALSALAFLYREVLGQENAVCLKDVRPAVPAGRTPVVFSPGEARAVLSRMRGENFLAAALMYGSGLRLSEAVALRVGDLDFENREIVVRHARTGRRERTTLLPLALRPALEKHLANVRYLFEDDLLLGHGGAPLPERVARYAPAAGSEWRWQFAFPARSVTGDAPAYRHHLAESTVQKAVAEAVLKTGLKPAGCQSFRYGFAARLFEQNCDVRRIQSLLGHKNLKTTVFYMRLAAGEKSVIQSPLDV